MTRIYSYVGKNTLSMFYKQRSDLVHPWSILNLKGCCLIFNGKFGKAEKLLIEEFLIGEEMSFFTIHDGKVFKNFETAQDHKRVLEGDTKEKPNKTYRKNS